jgi:glycosyltransferase involved in cell wall biosynthesis
VQPRLSVIIPCRNSDPVLGGQLRALAEQRCDRLWEVIVADNGSRDRTAALARSFALELPAIRVIDAGARRGAAYARNAGAAAAEGSLLLFCDADDEMAPGYLQAMGRALDSHDFVACRYDYTRLNHTWLAAARDGGGHTSGPGTGFCHPTLTYGARVGSGSARPFTPPWGASPKTCASVRDRRTPNYCIRVQLAGSPLVFVPDAVMHVRMKTMVSGLFLQARAWAESGAYVRERYHPNAQADGTVLHTAASLLRHLGWRVLRTRSSADLARSIWFAGWSAGWVEARIRMTIQEKRATRPPEPFEP